MTVDRVESIGVPLEFAWENLIESARTKDGGLQMAYDYFFNSYEDCLVKHFDRLFGTDKFSFDIKSLKKHKEIIEILDTINMSEVDCHMDILGWVYEQHINTGANSSGRDLGQFFTDRFICEYMTKICDPKIRDDGKPESVLDPAMGTGGFLTSYVKHFKNNYLDNPIDWTVHEKEIHGCDTDNRVAGVARLNMFMEMHGVRTTNLCTHDSLYGDLVQGGYDIILANMPFGLKGIVYDDCCERVTNLKIKGTKSEPLFLQIMMASLNLGGRCAVVVPDGMLMNSTTCHNKTRKYLLDNFELKRVIKMKGKFFMNTGIEPSILFFENTGKPTENVEFWSVVRGDNNNDVSEELILSVPREKIEMDSTCSFDMRRYMDIDNPSSESVRFPMMKLNEICEHKNGKSSYEKTDEGIYNVMGGGSKYVGKCNSYNRDGETISISKSGASAGFVAYHTDRFWAGDCFTIRPLDLDICSHKYLYYYLRLNNHLITSNITGTTIPHCKWNDIEHMSIPLPPIEVQDQIVTSLDRIYTSGTSDLSDTNKITNRAMDLILKNPDGSTLEPIVDAIRLMKKSGEMIKDLRSQMIDIMKCIRQRGFSTMTLNELCDHKNGKTLKSSDKCDDGLYDVMGGGTKYIGKCNTFNREGETITISKSGASAGFVAFHTREFWAGDCFTITPRDASTCSIKYLYYYLRMNNELLTSRTSGTTIPHCKWSDVENITIPVPPIDFQLGIIEKLDTIQSYISSYESLNKHSEDTARFILETYLS